MYPPSGTKDSKSSVPPGYDPRIHGGAPPPTYYPGTPAGFYIPPEGGYPPGTPMPTYYDPTKGNPLFAGGTPNPHDSLMTMTPPVGFHPTGGFQAHIVVKEESDEEKISRTIRELKTYDDTKIANILRHVWESLALLDASLEPMTKPFEWTVFSRITADTKTPTVLLNKVMPKSPFELGGPLSKKYETGLVQTLKLKNVAHDFPGTIAVTFDVVTPTKSGTSTIYTPPSTKVVPAGTTSVHFVCLPGNLTPHKEEIILDKRSEGRPTKPALEKIYREERRSSSSETDETKDNPIHKTPAEIIKTFSIDSKRRDVWLVPSDHVIFPFYITHLKLHNPGEAEKYESSQEYHHRIPKADIEDVVYLLTHRASSHIIGKQVHKCGRLRFERAFASPTTSKSGEDTESRWRDPIEGAPGFSTTKSYNIYATLQADIIHPDIVTKYDLFQDLESALLLEFSHRGLKLPEEGDPRHI